MNIVWKLSVIAETKIYSIPVKTAIKDIFYRQRAIRFSRKLTKIYNYKCEFNSVFTLWVTALFVAGFEMTVFARMSLKLDRKRTGKKIKFITSIPMPIRCSRANFRRITINLQRSKWGDYPITPKYRITKNSIEIRSENELKKTLISYRIIVNKN